MRSGHSLLKIVCVALVLGTALSGAVASQAQAVPADGPQASQHGQSAADLGSVKPAPRHLRGISTDGAQKQHSLFARSSAATVELDDTVELSHLGFRFTKGLITDFGSSWPRHVNVKISMSEERGFRGNNSCSTIGGRYDSCILRMAPSLGGGVLATFTDSGRSTFAASFFAPSSLSLRQLPFQLVGCSQARCVLLREFALTPQVDKGSVPRVGLRVPDGPIPLVDNISLGVTVTARTADGTTLALGQSGFSGIPGRAWCPTVVIQWRATPRSTWSKRPTTLDCSSGRTSVILEEAGEIRAEILGTFSPTQSVSLLRRNGKYTFARFGVDRNQIIGESTIVFSGVIATGFKDGSLRRVAGIRLELQSRVGSKWTSVASTSTATGGSFRVQRAVKSSTEFRIAISGRGPISKSLTVTVVSDTGKREFKGVSLSEKQIVASMSTAISGRVVAVYSDGKARAAALERVELQRLLDGSWKLVKSIQARSDGSFRIDLTPQSSGKYRLAARRSVSSAIDVIVVAPTPKTISVGWPQTLYSWDSFHMQAGVRDSAGRWWRGSVKLVFQFRTSRFGTWRDLDYGYASATSFATLLASYQGDGYYRVYAPSLGLQSEISYA